MTDVPIDIIDTTALANYLQTSVTAGMDSLVELANGVVSEAWVTPEDPIPWWVTAIALEVAARPARNPKGLASWTRSIDDGSRTERLPDSAARAGVYLLPDEETQLRRGREITRSGRRFRAVRTPAGYGPVQGRLGWRVHGR